MIRSFSVTGTGPLVHLGDLLSIKKEGRTYVLEKKKEVHIKKKEILAKKDVFLTFKKIFEKRRLNI